MNTSQDKFNLHFSIPSMSSPIHVEFVENITISTLYIYFERKDNGILRLLLLLLSHFSRVRLCATPQMAAHQAPPSLGFSRQEY